MPRISKRVVDAAQPSEDGKRYVIWDERLTGFGLLVLPTGVRSFIYDYRNGHGVKRRATISKVGSLTPDKAREQAEEMAAAVKRGEDPLAIRQGKRQAATVGDLLDAYLESEKFKSKADSTRAIDRGRIERHLRPTLGRKHADTLSDEDVRKAFTAIRDGRTSNSVKTKARGLARVTGGEGTARMAIRLLRAVLTWAIRDGRAKSNPAASVDVGTDGEREVILSPEHYKSLFSTLTKMENEKRIRSSVADAIRLIALTGARRGEAAGLKWQYVDLRQGRIVLPPSTHKTGRKTSKPRIISLPSAAQEIISRQPAGGPDDRVFRSSTGNGDINLSKPWRSVRKEANLPEGVGLHGLRHSLASHLAMGGAQAAEIMSALGHRQLSTTQRYIHWADGARATLAERAAGPALAGMSAATGDDEADVVLLDRSKA